MRMWVLFFLYMLMYNLPNEVDTLYKHVVNEFSRRNRYKVDGLFSVRATIEDNIQCIDYVVIIELN
jgi:hypothetical protein